MADSMLCSMKKSREFIEWCKYTTQTVCTGYMAKSLPADVTGREMIMRILNTLHHTGPADNLDLLSRFQCRSQIKPHTSWIWKSPVKPVQRKWGRPCLLDGFCSCLFLSLFNQFFEFALLFLLFLDLGTVDTLYTH